MPAIHASSRVAPRVEPRPPSLSEVAVRAESAGKFLVRYGLVLVLLWIGGMKFTAVEAEAIRPFAENSPLFAWAYPLLGAQLFSSLLGAAELVIAFMIASRPLAPRVSAAGSLLAIGMFLSTLSFLLTTPGAWVDQLGGFPAMGVPGQFVLKDIVLLGAAVWSFGEALRAVSRTPMSRSFAAGGARRDVT